MTDRAPDNYFGMILGLAFVLAGCAFLLGGLLPRRKGQKAGRAPDLVVLRGWLPVFARMWLVIMGLSVMGWGAAAFFDNLIYADTHRHQSGVGLVFWPTFAICLGLAAMFIQPSTVPNLKGAGLLFYRLTGLVFVGIGGYGVFVILSVGRGLWNGVLPYINDIQTFISTGQPIA